MKRKQLLALSIAAVLGAVLFLSSCSRMDNIDSRNQSKPTALMAVNLLPESTVGINLSGNNFTPVPLAYGSFTGDYRLIYPGVRVVSSFDVNTNSALSDTSFTFEEGKHYSLFLLGTTTDPEQVIVKDNVDSLVTTTQTFVRYINAIADGSTPQVTVSVNGTTVVNEAAAFKYLSEFKAIEPGEVTVTVSNGSMINATRTITLEKQKVYTLLLSGKAGSTGENAVQVKFILNGMVDDSI